MKLDWRPIPWNAPSAKGPVRVIALMQDPGVIRRILEHLGLWAPQVKERGPPLDFASWPPYASLPLTYHQFSTSPERGRARRRLTRFARMICRHARCGPSTSADRAAERVLTLQLECGQGAWSRLRARGRLGREVNSDDGRIDFLIASTARQTAFSMR